MKRGRKPFAIPTEGVRIFLPVDLLSELNLYCFDPVQQRIKYGMRSELIERLLREWIQEQRKDSVLISKANVEETPQ